MEHYSVQASPATGPWSLEESHLTDEGIPLTHKFLTASINPQGLPMEHHPLWVFWL